MVKIYPCRGPVNVALASANDAGAVDAENDTPKNGLAPAGAAVKGLWLNDTGLKAVVKPVDAAPGRAVLQSPHVVRKQLLLFRQQSHFQSVLLPALAVGDVEGAGAGEGAAATSLAGDAAVGAVPV